MSLAYGDAFRRGWPAWIPQEARAARGAQDFVSTSRTSAVRSERTWTVTGSPGWYPPRVTWTV